MISRPYERKSFDELREEFNSSRRIKGALESLLHELRFRNKNRKVPALKEEIKQALAKCNPEKVEKITSPVKTAAAPCGFKLRGDTPEISVKVPEKWDVEQRTVIELGEDETKIVEAGPGAGKTAVACARVVHLIEDCGLEASKIFLVSFTRIAVKELRDRIETFAQAPVSVAGLQIFTLDSFTWQVLRGLGDDQSVDLMSNYGTNIKSFIQQLKDGEAQLLDYLEEFEHVVLDEGQDLVGDRADLAIQIIQRLEAECGVTIFADSAQAIYGFTDDSEQHGNHQSLTVVERIMQGEISDFGRIKLVNVHRTHDKNLIRLFQSGRNRLLDKKESDINGWLAMKQLITGCSHGEVGAVKEQQLKDNSDCLVLFRTRAEVLMASSYLWADDVIHKLRMSGIAQRVHPWIGRLFGEFQGDFLDQQEFNRLWSEKIGEIDCGTGIDEAWQLLWDNAGDKNHRIKMVRLREILSRDRPPIDFLIDESQLVGPVLGTIHASKGREANQVHLMLPPDKYLEVDETSKYALSPREIAEEERVLFVGATRAKQHLMVGEGAKMYASRLDSGRTYKRPSKGRNRRMVEIGLVGDIDLTSIADGRLGEDIQDLQEWFWINTIKKIETEAIYDREQECCVLFSKADEKPLGLFSKRFSKDIWELSNIVAEKEGLTKPMPSSKINNIRMLGVTTVVIPEAIRNTLETPWRHSGFLLAPVITGFPMVYFNQRNKK